MSYAERARRREMAAAAAARYGELLTLIEERVKVQAMRPLQLRHLREGGCPWAAEMRGTWPETLITYLEEGGAPAAVVAAVAADCDAREADLSARIAEFGPDPALAALLEADLAAGQGRD